MKKSIPLLLLLSLCLAAQAQKKSKKKEKNEITNYDSLGTKPINTKSSKKVDKKGKKDTKTSSVNYTPDVITPVPDSSKKFTGVIKYLITSDDPADKDSVFIVFGENRIRITRFIPGYRADQVFEENMIANFNDSTFLELDSKNKTYKTEKLGARNAGIEFSMAPDKKTGKVMTFTCEEYIGEMATKEGETFEAACLVSNQHSYIYNMDYNFLNIQPLVLGYKIVLGFRTRSTDNENTYFMAYKIEPGNADSWFDLSGYKSLQ